MRKYISEVIGQDYIKWKKGDLILITGGTSTGKSTFIKKSLNTYCYQNGKKILYLTNRTVLKNQVKSDLDNIDNNITVMNYQQIEKNILEHTKLDNFDYVVMDEAHYFFTDASFNRKTDLFFKRMLEDNTICKIMMTATPILLLKYIGDKGITINYKYELPTDYRYIHKITAFSTEESIDSIIEDVPQNEQIIFFGSAKKALELSKKYNGAFICSKNNKDGYYKKYIEDTENEEELNNIVENSCFKNHLLCCTTCLDNGINIKENTPVKHIIIDIVDRDTFIQCLGRKRVADGEYINLYFNSYRNKRKINGYKNRVNNTLEKANYLLEHGQKAYVQHKFKTDQFSDGRIIDEIIDADGNTIKVINKCMYAKLKFDLLLYNSLTDKKFPLNYKSIVTCALGIKYEEIDDLEVKYQKTSVNEILGRNVGRKLYKQDQKELIEFIGLKDKRGRLQKSIGTLNAYLEESKLPYVIKTDTNWDRKLEDGSINAQRGKKYWMIYKLVG